MPSTPRMKTLEEEFSADYVDEQHMQAFAQALAAPDDEGDLCDSPIGTPGHLTNRSGSLHSGTSSPRVRKVSALSDFAPVHVRVKRRRRGQGQYRPHRKRQEWLFLLSRWPLLLFIFLFIFFEFGLYIFIRQCVNAKEWFTAWRGRKGQLRKQLRAAQSYEEWKKTALTLDQYLKFDEWKTIDEDDYYDWRLVRKVYNSLVRLRKEDDVRGVLGVLETCIRTNFAGVESSRLYSETYLGTKNLIEAYITEVERALIYIRESTVLTNEEKRRFFKSTGTNLGVTALCLSGGATFGYYHFGVIRAFVQANLLPRVITGTSAGALVAAFACTRTDAELKALLIPRLADKITACEESFAAWLYRFWTTGARFDSVEWARKGCFFTRGSLTFKEAYRRTGRILNVSVIPADRHSPTKLLNYMTAPDTVIWSAIIASAAVPGILNPVVLMQKTKDGQIVPWNWGSKFKDGSLRVDIPLQSLNLYFNVTHPIVSQVNPHVHLFFFAPRGSAGKPVAHRKNKGWRGNFLLSAAEQYLKLELTKNFKLIRDLDLLPQLLGQDWSSVFLQRFDGSVTIWPKTRLMDWVHILSDPDRAELERMMQIGQNVTWPKLHIIENRYRLEREIFRGRQAVRVLSRQTERPPPPDVNGQSSHDPGNIPDTSAAADQDAHSEGAVVDSETETGILNILQLQRLQSEEPRSGASTPPQLKSSKDPLRSASRRRTWVTQLFDAEGSTNSPRGTSPAPNGSLTAQPQPPNPSPPPRSFFANLRSRSFPHFPTPFGSLQATKRPSQESTPDDIWSSESSDDESQFGERLSRRPSSMIIPSSGPSQVHYNGNAVLAQGEMWSADHNSNSFDDALSS